MPTDLADHFPLRRGRAHEVCGASAAVFAAVAAGLAAGPVLWLREGWRGDRLDPNGLAPFCDPARLVIAEGRDQTELLAAAEEALRSGAVPLVIAELGAPIGLTAGRRLQLAAESGRATGLMLISEDAGSNAAETRWRATPLFSPQDSTLQRWQLIKNKSGTFGTWTVRWDAKAHRIIVVSEAGD